MEEKIKVIKATESGTPKADVCREFRLVAFTVQTIWKIRERIVSVFEENGLRFKRLRKPEQSDVSEALLKGSSNKEVRMRQ